MTALSANNVSLSIVSISAFRRYQTGETTGKSEFTGFIWKFQNEYFLFSNWHNFTGINPDTGKPLGTFTPSMLEISYWVRGPTFEDGTARHSIRSSEFSLYANDIPIWTEHPSGRDIDLAALRLIFIPEENINLIALNDVTSVSDLVLNVGLECFIVGFPEGIPGPQGTPIWKRASIATEPELDANEKPQFLVDSIGNSGLSGSPVVATGKGTKNVQSDTVFVSGVWSEIIGVYSGRMSPDGVGSQLGRVWKRHLLDEVCANLAMCPPNPHTS